MQKIGIVMMLAVALFAVPVLAQNTVGGTGNVDILAQGIFEADGSAIQIPTGENANLDGVIVGNDRALAFGAHWDNGPIPTHERFGNQEESTRIRPIIDTTGLPDQPNSFDQRRTDKGWETGKLWHSAPVMPSTM